MLRTPTEEQRQVIESSESRFLVTASAGAGKTYVLVERYLWMIENLGLEPHQILTITFTRKAAAEMKDRIVKRLRSMGFDERAQVAETGPIQTIHSFCERLLRENSLAAGIDPDFEIIDEGERTRLEDFAIAKAITSSREEHPEAEALLQFLAGQRDFGRASPHAKLESAIARVLSGLRGTQVTLSEVQSLSDPQNLERHLQDRLVGSLKPEIRDSLRFVNDGDFASRVKESFKRNGLKPPPLLSRTYNPRDLEVSLRHTAGLVQLASRAWSELEFEMHRRQKFDYALLEAKAVKLLSESEQVRRRISNQYGALMVDEAQDVNPVQHKLLDSLNIERMMIVGDVQQSIYGFRLADVDIFRERQAQLPTLKLTKNWRSRKGILNFVDQLFSVVWDASYDRMAEAPQLDLDVVELPNCDGVEIWEMADKDLAQTALHIVEMHKETGIPLKDITVLARFSRYANELHHRLQGMGIKSRIVGGSEKFYVRLEIRDLANILKALADPYDDFALLAALRSPIAGVSLSALAELALAKPVAESLADYTPESTSDREALERFLAWFHPLSQIADRLSAWEVLGKVLAQSNYVSALARKPGGERMIANVRKLLSLAAKDPELGPAEFAEQIREIQRLAHKEGDAPVDDEDEDTLTIMTIHKAKGLEFEAVVIPDVHRKIGGRTEAVEVDARLGLIATKFAKEENLYHLWLAQLRKDRELEEELRVLYVSMTRAKQRLCLTAHSKPRNANSLAGKIGKNLGLNAAVPLGVVKRGIGAD
jgi:ATP-dependent helicase/nuclease subunit A